MSELKTKPNNRSVGDFIDRIEPREKRDDSLAILRMMQEISGEPPTMWGDSIIGFGNYHLKYESGRELDWFLAGFSPRKQNLTIYITSGFSNQDSLLEKLGTYKKSVGCLYIKKLDDVDVNILRTMIEDSIEYVKKKYAEFN